MAFSGGFLVGPIWGGFITERGGWDTMVTSLAGLAIITLFPTLYFVGGPMNGWRDGRKIGEIVQDIPA